MGTYYIGETISISGLKKGDTLLVKFDCDTGLHTKTINVTTDNFTFQPTLTEYAPYLQTTRSGRLTLTINPGSSSPKSYVHDLLLPSHVKPVISSCFMAYRNTFNNKPIQNISTGEVVLKIAGVYGVKQTCTITEPSTGKILCNGTISAINETNAYSAMFSVGITDRNKTLSIKLVDTRGSSCSTTISINDIQPYSPIQVSISVDWNYNLLQPLITTKITKQNTVAGVDNPLTLSRIKYDSNSDEEPTRIFELPSLEYTGVLPGEFDSGKSYDIIIEAADSVLPNSIVTKMHSLSAFEPTVDFGADGHTVALFGSAPAASSRRSLRVGDNAVIWEDEIELGGYDNLVINGDGIAIRQGINEQLHFGNGNVIITNPIGDPIYNGDGIIISSSNNNVSLSTTQTKDPIDTAKGGKSALDLYYDPENDIAGLALSVKKGTSYTDLYESEGRGIFMEYGNYDDGLSADISVFGDNTNVCGTNTIISGDSYLRLESEDRIKCQSPDVDCDFGGYKVLWTGQWWMTASQQINFNSLISKQLIGAVFVWSHFNVSNGTADNWEWSYFLVPKYHVKQHSGAGIRMDCSATGMSKYIYVRDGYATGNDSNTLTTTSNGVQRKNNEYVLRAVLGI